MPQVLNRDEALDRGAGRISLFRSMPLVDTNCIFCGKESLRVDWEENGFTGRRCECGLLYISPRPTLNEILDRYNSDQASVRARSRIQSQTLGRLIARHRLSILRGYKTGGDLLEVGPGNGSFLDESGRRGFEPFGIELDHKRAQFIRERFEVPVETKPFSSSSFGGMLFDAICHFDVISHFYDPVFEFRQFHERLKDDGILFFETGNGGDLSRGWLKFIGRLQYPEHLFLFSKKNIETLCQKTGFRIVKVYRYSIVFHLVAIKLLMWIRDRASRGKGRIRKNGEKHGLPGMPESDSWGRRSLLNTAVRINLFLRYGIGGGLPKIGPQTMIYVAQKNPIDGSK